MVSEVLSNPLGLPNGRPMVASSHGATAATAAISRPTQAALDAPANLLVEAVPSNSPRGPVGAASSRGVASAAAAGSRVPRKLRSTRLRPSLWRWCLTAGHSSHRLPTARSSHGAGETTAARSRPRHVALDAPESVVVHVVWTATARTVALSPLGPPTAVSSHMARCISSSSSSSSSSSGGGSSGGG